MISDLGSLLAFAIVFFYRERKVTSRLKPDCSLKSIGYGSVFDAERFSFVTTMILLLTKFAIVDPASNQKFSQVLEFSFYWFYVKAE